MAKTPAKTPAPKKAAAKKKIGRPPKIVLDEKVSQTLSGLARIQATTKEAAVVLGVSEPTFIDFLKRDKKGRELWENGKLEGRVSLRRAQFAAAHKGNPAMLVWLGKQFLEQRDKAELTGKDGKPLPAAGATVTVFALPDNGRDAPANGRT